MNPLAATDESMDKTSLFFLESFDDVLNDKVVEILDRFRESVESTALEVHSTLDLDHDGKVDESELKEALRSLGVANPVLDEALKAKLAAQGSISLQQFKSILEM